MATLQLLFFTPDHDLVFPPTSNALIDWYAWEMREGGQGEMLRYLQRDPHNCNWWFLSGDHILMISDDHHPRECVVDWRDCNATLMLCGEWLNEEYIET